MKKIAVLGALTLAVGVMVVAAVLMFAPSFGGTTPALAHENPIQICHFDKGFTKSNPGSASFRAPSWEVILVNHKAVDKHVPVHTNGVGLFDQLVPGTISAIACVAQPTGGA